jgi:hypothetical protein
MGACCRPGGILITLMFPLHKRGGGEPPHGVSLPLYHGLLDELFELVHHDEWPRSIESRKGHEAMAVWRRRQ